MKKKRYMILAMLSACMLLTQACGSASEGKKEGTTTKYSAESSNTTTEKNPNTTVEKDTTTKQETTAEKDTTTKQETTVQQETTAEQQKQPQQTENTPYGKHGKLSVDGVNLVDESGALYQLYGMSTHGITWFPEYVNYEAFKTLRDDWNTNCVRLALYTAEYNGYCTGGNQQELKKLVHDGVRYATDLGMYVIIDWHVLNDNDPNVHKEQAKSFFSEMSDTYADYENLIYEICNEPCGYATWDSVKSYANEIIPIIRKNDSDAVIIVGTPTWSQDIDKAAESPLEFDNIMYALHFYAATHTDWLRQRAESCINSDLPIFISEFGTCDASGNGGNDFYQMQEWMNLIKKHNISYCCWNLANKQESSSAIQSWCSDTSWWDESELSESGKWIRNQFRNED